MHRICNKAKWIPIIAIILLIFSTLNLGITAAAWSTQRTAYNKVTANFVEGKIHETYEQNQIIMPNVDIQKQVWFENMGSTEAFVRVKVTYQFDDGTPLTSEDISFTWDEENWAYNEDDGYWYYCRALKPHETTTHLFDTFKLSGTLTNSTVGETGRVVILSEWVQAENDGLHYWNIKEEKQKSLGIQYKQGRYPESIMHVNFWGRTKGIEFPDGYDMFFNFKNLVPGCCRSQDIVLKNESDEPIYMSLRAELGAYESRLDEHSRKLVDEMLRKYMIITITDNDGKTFYAGPAWGNLDGDPENRFTSMKYAHDLGCFSPGEKKNLHIAMQFSKEMPTNYTDLVGYVNWVFDVTALTEKPDIYGNITFNQSHWGIPKTGDTLPDWVMYVTLTSGLVTLALGVVLLKRNRKEAASR